MLVPNDFRSFVSEYAQMTSPSFGQFEFYYVSLKGFLKIFSALRENMGSVSLSVLIWSGVSHVAGLLPPFLTPLTPPLSLSPRSTPHTVHLTTVLWTVWNFLDAPTDGGNAANTLAFLGSKARRLWETVKHQCCGTPMLWNPFGTMWNTMEHCGTHVEHCGTHMKTLWNTVEPMWNPYRTLWKSKSDAIILVL